MYIGETLTGSGPRRIGLLDPFGGLAGDMLLGALIDLAASDATGSGETIQDFAAWLRLELFSLGLHGWSLRVEATERRQIGCTRASFDIPPEHRHRHLPEIRDRIAASSLPARAKAKAIESFERLAEAEARVHRIPVDRVHFHEVGAADAILDICGCSLLLDRLGVDELRCGPLPGGSGTIRCDHGELPCPAPAVVYLLEDFVVLPGVGEGEMVTPTGAALLRAWGRALRPGELGLAHMRTGYGAGTRSSSVVRLAIGEARLLAHASPDGDASAGEWLRDEVLVLETHLDDETGEHLAYVAERLLERGALDVAFAPLTMKKNRPGVALTVMVPPALRADAIALLLHETTALGVREQIVTRTILPRRSETIDTAWGPVRIKWAGGRPRPEYEDLAALARAHRLPLHEVEQRVLRSLRSEP